MAVNKSLRVTINSFKVRIANQLTHRAPVCESIINFPLKCIIAQYFYGYLFIRSRYSREDIYKWIRICCRPAAVSKEVALCAIIAEKIAPIEARLEGVLLTAGFAYRLRESSRWRAPKECVGKLRSWSLTDCPNKASPAAARIWSHLLYKNKAMKLLVNQRATPFA